MNKLGLDNQTLSSHIAWDIGSGSLASALSRLLDAPLVMTNYSRLVIDCNRTPGTQDSIIKVSAGTHIPGNQNLHTDEIERREKYLFRPYHNAISSLLENRDEPFVIISIHSFTPILDRRYRPWKIGVCYGKDDRLAGPILEALSRQHIDSVGDNEPYNIDPDIDYSLPFHTKNKNSPHVMLEIRNDQIDTIEGVNAWAFILKNALSAIEPDL